MRSFIHSLRVRISRTLMLLAIGMTTLLWSLQTYAADRAEAFVQTQIETSRMILQNPQLSPDQRREQFRDLMLSITDTRRVALFAAGPYASQADKPDLERYIAAFAQFSGRFYERLLDNYAQQAIRVTGSTRRSVDDAIVLAEVDDRKGPPLKMAFRVRANEKGAPILTDFQVEGAWLALAQRAEFISFLQQHHGDLTQLSQELEKRARSDRTGAPQNPPSS